MRGHEFDPQPGHFKWMTFLSLLISRTRQSTKKISCQRITISKFTLNPLQHIHVKLSNMNRCSICQCISLNIQMYICSNPTCSRGRPLVPFQRENRMPVPDHQINNKYVYRQRQFRKPTGSEVKWSECSLIIGTGYWCQMFNVILDSSVGLLVGIQSAGDSVPETQDSNPAFSRG